METNQSLLNTELQIDPTGHAHLSETAKWGTFLSIVGFILSGLIAIVALFSGTILGSLSSGFGSGSSIAGAGMVTFIYLLIAALYFFMSLFLYRFASKMKQALFTIDQDSLNNSLLNLRNLYRMMGILTIVYLAVFLLALVIGFGAAMMQ